MGMQLLSYPDAYLHVYDMKTSYFLLVTIVLMVYEYYKSSKIYKIIINTLTLLLYGYFLIVSYSKYFKYCC